MDLTEILSNPVRNRIIQHLILNKEATTKQISSALDDVPAPTIYRHINYLLNENVLVVKEERKVRGTTERLLAIDEETMASGSDDLVKTSYQFLMSLFTDFQKYGSGDDADPQKDRLCLRTCILRLSDEDFDSFIAEYAELLGKYLEKEDGGKLRRVSIISSPIIEEE